MSWERDTLAMPAEELARVNGAEMLAVQLQNAIRDLLATQERHRSELADLRSIMTETQKIGLAVLRARTQGRKTLRLDELQVPPIPCVPGLPTVPKGSI